MTMTFHTYIHIKNVFKIYLFFFTTHQQNYCLFGKLILILVNILFLGQVDLNSTDIYCIWPNMAMVLGGKGYD